jgi:hypothetical protein
MINDQRFAEMCQMTQCIQLSADPLKIVTFEEAVIHGCGENCAHSMVIKIML